MEVECRERHALHHPQVRVLLALLVVAFFVHVFVVWCTPNPPAKREPFSMWFLAVPTNLSRLTRSPTRDNDAQRVRLSGRYGVYTPSLSTIKCLCINRDEAVAPVARAVDVCVWSATIKHRARIEKLTPTT